MISFGDFSRAVGSEIHPGETLYFRQDLPHREIIQTRAGCTHPLCMGEQSSTSQFCAMHLKMYTEEVKKFYRHIYR
jgi:hypothetical protein